MMDLFDDDDEINGTVENNQNNKNSCNTSVILEQSNEEGSVQLRIPQFRVLSHEEVIKSSANLSTTKNIWNMQDE